MEALENGERMGIQPVKEALRRAWLWVGCALAAAMALKAWLVAGGYVPFNADEAIVALMARHILGGARPVFFYGQAYMGSLDAFLVALAFQLFGEQVWAIRLVQALLYLGVLVTTGVLGKQAFGSWRVGGLAVGLLAIPTVNVTLYTTASLGGYGEALLVGNLILICGLRISQKALPVGKSADYWLWAFLGLLIGLGLWAFGLTLVYSLPALVYLLVVEIYAYRMSRGAGEGGTARRWFAPWLALLAGALLGSAPWWGYALQNGLEKLVGELGGGAIAGVEQMPWVFQVAWHLISLLMLGSLVTFGLRPPWEVTWLALPLLPFVLLFWMAVVVYIIRRLRLSNPFFAAQALLVGVMLTLLAGFIFTSFGADPSGRYFLPLAIPLALFAAAMILDLRERWGAWAFALVALLLVYNLLGTIQSARRNPPGITTQFYSPAQVDHRAMPELIEFLRENGESRGYSNYWVAYPLAFLSDETLIFVPRLPYHPDFRYTERDDRYPAYDEQVAQAEQVAYITTNHPDLDERLRQGFSGLGVSWREARIGDYQVFYALSRAVRPAEMGLGSTTP
jgi:4-amino-4-deoxy-L-arabinose transferase-like glycosyltransferase